MYNNKISTSTLIRLWIFVCYVYFPDDDMKIKISPTLKELNLDGVAGKEGVTFFKGVAVSTQK